MTYWQGWRSLLILILIAVPFRPSGVRAIDTSRDAFLNASMYNALIGDNDFLDKDSMSTSDIQNFLQSQNSYLAEYSQNGRSAAQIIYDAAHGQNEASGKLQDIDITTTTGTVSPKVLLVTLQKEESLISLTRADRDTNVESYNNRLNVAMGYGCPDSASCNPAYKGFTLQVENAAWQFRYNYEAAAKPQSWWNQYYPASDAQACKRQYYVGSTCSLSDGTGTYGVTLSNKATSSLYRYTPHVFNGNYNFWKLMNTYFSPGAANITVAAVVSNDTGTFAGATYKDAFKVSGSKMSDSLVFYNGSQVAGTGSTSWSLTITPDIGKKTYSIEYRDGLNQVTATKTGSIDRRTVGDIDGNGNVELPDLSLLGGSYGIGVPDGDWRDLNADGQVDILDLSLFANQWK